jgi:hypothetical protein
VTWRSLRAWLMRSTEEAERKVLQHVHGDSLKPGVLDGKVAATEAMIFPFSPPMMVPCPYSKIKQSMGLPSGVDKGSGGGRGVEATGASAAVHRQHQGDVTASASGEG